MRPCLHLAGLAQHADPALAGARAPDPLLVAHRRALRGLLRARRRQGVAGARWRMTCTSGTAAANYVPGGDRGPPRAGAADRADRRPARRSCATSAPARRSTSSSSTATRSSGSSRSASTSATPERAALDPRARLPRLLDRARAAGPGRSTSTSRCASRWCSTSRSPTRSGARAAPTGGRGSSCVAPRAGGRPRPRRTLIRRAGVVVAGRDERGRRARPAAAAGVRRSGRLPAARRSAVRRPARPGGDRHLRPPAARPVVRRRLRPEFVLRFGDLPTSKPLRAWLAGLRRTCPSSPLDPEAAWQDPAAVAQRRPRRRPGRRRCGSLEPAGAADPDWLRALAATPTTAVSAALARELGGELSEPLVAPAARRALAPGGDRCSSPPRCRSATSSCILPARRPPAAACSPTAAPTGSTAPSRPRSASRPPRDAPVVLLIGDVALAHDIGGLLAARRPELELTIVLLNNDGGGIFHFLPVSGQTDAFEEHRRHPARARLRARRRAVRPRLRAPRDRRRAARGAERRIAGGRRG